MTCISHHYYYVPLWLPRYMKTLWLGSKYWSVVFSSLMPWEELEETYAPQFNPTTGAPAKPVRLAFGALFIKQRLGLTDEETVEQIRENAYMQFFLGFVKRHRKLSHFRHRKLSHSRPGLGPCFRSGSALVALAVPLLAHGFRDWLRWLSSVIDAGGAVPAVFLSDLLGWRRWR